MKNKLAVALLVLALLCGFFVTSISFRPEVRAGVMYHLDVFTDPSLIPINGTGDYPEGTYVELQALNEYIVGNTKYLFAYWDVDGINVGSSNPYKWVYMDKDRNATAHYKTQYKLTVETQYGTPCIWCIDCGGSGQWYDNVTEHWCDANKNAYAGVTGLWDGPPAGLYVPGCPNQWAYLVNWTEDASGYNVGGPPPYYFSDPINMTGPKHAVALWAYMFRLYVLSGSPPPLPDPPASLAGWYYECTYVSLIAPDPHPTWINPGFARWRFDYWELDGVPQLPPDVNLTVHMDKNHTATLYYLRQSFMTLRDDIGNQSGIWDNGKWYDNCVYYTFTAPTYVYIDNLHRYRFVAWTHSNLGTLGTSPTITFHINSTSDGATLKAVYHMQYYLGVFSSGSEVPGFLYPDSDTSGFYDAGSTRNLKARPIVQIDPTKRYKFVQWKNHLGGTTSLNNFSFTMDRPWNMTAEYDLEWLIKWDHSPSTITVIGSPGQDWRKNGTDVWYGLPATDVSGTFAFWYWLINGATYPQGQNLVYVGKCTGSIDGTAYYANKTKLFMDPTYHNETAHAYCNKFNVTIYATNFDADRQITGNPMDIYGFDIVIDFNATLIEVQDVYLNLGDFFAPNDYFIAINRIDNVGGTYRLVATVKGNFTGFEGTKAIFTLTFHVIYDPCYPYDGRTWIEFSNVTLVNHLGQEIWPELGSVDCQYVINTVMPMLDVRDAADGDHLIVVQKNVPQTYFDVDVWLLHGVKVHDFFVVVQYDNTQIEAESVTIGNYLKPPYVIYSWQINKALGWVIVQVGQEEPPQGAPLQNCSGKLFTVRFKVIKAIYYSICGLKELTSDITIYYGALSVKCPIDRWQETPKELGVIKAKYVYMPLPGDLDFDGEVTVLDLQLIADNYCTGKYDITCDGTCDIKDLVFVALRFNNKVK